MIQMNFDYLIDEFVGNVGIFSLRKRAVTHVKSKIIVSF